VPEHFAERGIDALHALIGAHPPGAIVRMAAGGLEGDHLPFELAVTTDVSQGAQRRSTKRPPASRDPHGRPTTRRPGTSTSWSPQRSASRSRSTASKRSSSSARTAARQTAPACWRRWGAG